MPPSALSAAPRRRTRRKEARPAEIVEAALAVFAERGFAAARLEEVAHRAGVSKGTLYLYFSGKQELFEAVVRQAVLPDIGRLEAVAASHSGPVVPLLGQLLAEAACMFGAGRVGLMPKMVIAEAANFPDLARFWVSEVVERGTRMMHELLARGVARGELAPVRAEAAFVIIAPLLQLALWNHSLGPVVGRNLDPEQFGREASRILLDGLRVREEGE